MGCSEVGQSGYVAQESTTSESSQVTTSTCTPVQTTRPTTTTTTTATTEQKNDNTVLTQEQKMFAATLYAEAGANYVSNVARQYVAHSMYNRIGYGEWKSSENIIDVITQPWQYDGYGNGENAKYKSAMNYYENGEFPGEAEKKLMDECINIVTPILDGSQQDITGKITFFHSFDNPSDWPYHDSYVYVQLGDEFDGFHFYRWE